MIVTISGSQGQGKTTLLNAIKDEGYAIQYNTTARSVLHDMGMELSTVYSNPNLSIKFQNLILEKQTQIDDEINTRNELCVTERSYADIFTYALFAVGNINKYDDWLSEYYIQCVEAQKRYNTVVFLTGRLYSPQDDGVRSTNKHFGESVDVLVEYYAKKLCADSDIQYRSISLPDLDMRVASVQEILRDVK